VFSLSQGFIIMGAYGLSPAQQSAVDNAMAGKATQTKWNAYYSRLRISATSLAANVYSIGAGQDFLGFGYGKNQDMTAAGLPGVQSTPADTNIITPNQTVSGEMVLIDGIGIIVLPQSDANFLKQLDQCVSVKIKTNGSQEYLMGIPQMLPGPGGLMGAAEAWSVVPNLQEQLSRSVGIISNGVPHSSNFYPLPEPMVWGPAGKGDSAFNVILHVERAASTISQFGGAARSAGTGIAVYAPPTAAQVFVDYMIVVVGRTVNPLSDN
jgi:hypothetical protein